MRSSLHYLTLSRFGRLAYRTWGVSGHGRPALVLLHGLGEHSGRWEWIGQWFAGKGWYCVAPDHFGHGLSQGRRCHIERFDIWSGTITHLRNHLLRDENQVALFGHSLGGLIGMDAVLRSQDRWCAAAFSAPWLQLALEGRNFEKKLAYFLSRWWPSLSFPTGLRKEHMAEDLLVPLSGEDAALIHRRITARAYIEILHASQRLFKSADQFHLPCLVTHGSDDPVMRLEGSREWLERCGSPQKRLHVVENARHEPHHAKERGELLLLLHQWLTGARE